MTSTLLHTNIYNTYNPKSQPQATRKPTQNVTEKPKTNPKINHSTLTKTNQSNPQNYLSKPNNLTLSKTLNGLIESGSILNALNLFEKMSHSNAYVWNVVIKGLTKNGFFREAIEFYYRMEFEGVKADKFTLPFVVKACGNLMCLVEGEKVHAKLIKLGLDLDVYVGNFLIDMYVKVGCVELAERVFDGMCVHDLVSWNSMVCGYQNAGDGYHALLCFREMLRLGVKYDRFSVISVLGACCDEMDLWSVKEIHCQVIRSGLELDVMVQTSLVDTYGKCGNVDYAERVFNRIQLKNIVAWNAMIGGHALNARFHKSFHCVRMMQNNDGIIPDAITLINLIPSCSQGGAVLEGKWIHGYAIKNMLLPHLVLETALVDMYGECGNLKYAERVFSQISDRNLVSWNAMIAAYVQNGQHIKALELFQDIWYEPLKPDAVTFASILPSYAELALMIECKQIHACITKLELASNTIISNAIIYMYAKCGDLQTARIIFDGMILKNIVSWNTMIMSYAIHGFGKSSIQLFSEMKESGLEPNASTFVSLLSSCSISGLVEEGWKYFHSTKTDYNIDPGIEHHSCMIDLLGRSGNLKRAKQFIKDMHLTPTAKIWGSLLTACRNNRDIEMAEFAADHILSLEHDNTGCYVLLSNMYAEARRWQDVDDIRLIMKTKGLAKTKDCSIVEINGQSHKFINNDDSHPATSMIYSVLGCILKEIVEDPYVHSLTKFRPQDFLQRRAKSPNHHSVKLAICFGLISTPIGSPVIIRKNTRICEHCHRTAKKISLVTKREVIVGDSKIYHHFSDGQCSCGDYW